MSENDSFFLNYLRYLGSPKIEINGFGAQGHVQTPQNYRNVGFSVSPISKSNNYKFKLKQNNTTELLSIFP